jgi:hypothetical protein
MTTFSRRQALIAGAGAAAALCAAPAAFAASGVNAMTGGLAPALLRRALAAFDKHQARLARRDHIGVVDFSAPSRVPRFHLVNLVNGGTTSLLVAHGRGSDPGHSGFLERFSNEVGSLATSSGAYLVSDSYVGRHGSSRRLVGLDPQNSNAEVRAIVMHGAWYVGPDMVRDHGKLGRSEGCFAFAENELAQVFDRLAPGRLIYADKL